MNFCKSAILAIALTGLAGCAALENKWHTKTFTLDQRGAYPENYQQMIKDHMHTVLKDPFSAVYEFPEKPTESILSETVVTQWPTLINVNGYRTTTSKTTWRTLVRVNAKNSYGGYVGWKRYHVHITQQGVIKAEPLDE